MGTNVESLVCSVEEAGKTLGIGRSLAYTLARTGRLPGIISLGHRLVVSKSVLEAVLSGELKFNKES